MSTQPGSFQFMGVMILGLENLAGDKVWALHSAIHLLQKQLPNDHEKAPQQIGAGAQVPSQGAGGCVQAKWLMTGIQAAECPFAFTCHCNGVCNCRAGKAVHLLMLSAWPHPDIFSPHHHHQYLCLTLGWPLGTCS